MFYTIHSKTGAFGAPVPRMIAWNQLTADACLTDDHAAVMMGADLLDVAIARAALVMARTVFVTHWLANDALSRRDRYALRKGRSREGEDRGNSDQRRDEKSFHFETSLMVQ